MTSEAFKKKFDAGYREMADDATREADAEEWVEALEVLAANDLAVVAKSAGSSSNKPSTVRFTKPARQ